MIQKHILQKHNVIRGALILTLTGFATRLIGFFYRIFLSRSFGEEAVGLYQLVFPVYALCISLCIAGIETAVSRSVAAQASLGRFAQVKTALYAGFALSLFLACTLVLVLQKHASFIATSFLKEPRCEPLIILISYALPFSAIHGCICGYYIGLKHTKIPAVSQLLEQIVRVGGVFFLYRYLMQHSVSAGIAIAVIGLVGGEIGSSMYCLWKVSREFHHSVKAPIPISLYQTSLREIFTTAFPLTGNRVLLNILQSIEAVSIPFKLQAFGFRVDESLSIYGVLTGMALPCVLFPSAITNSIATMMLPTVAEIQALHHKEQIRSLVKKVTSCCFILGLGCTCVLLLFGNFIGSLLFHSKMAGAFIVTLAWICPFLYTNGNLISILNGLGKTTLSFLFNSIGLLIRIGSVFFLIPMFGIRGYLWGMLLSQLTVFALCLLYLFRYLSGKASEENVSR